MDNRSPDVDAWFGRYANPQKELVQAVREVTLEAEPLLSEAIRWKAPTFIYKGNMASFYPRTKARLADVPHRRLAARPHRPARRGRRNLTGSHDSSMQPTWQPSRTH